MIEDALGVALRHASAGGREGMVDAARHDPKALGYARITVGTENCAFCLMLVSRGPVYRSESAALLRDGTSEPYHDRCDCIAVPVFDRDDWPGRDEYLEMQRLWDEHANGNLKNWRRFIESRRDRENSQAQERAAAVGENAQQAPDEDIQQDLFDPSRDVPTADLPTEDRPLLAINPAPNPAEEAHRLQLQANADRIRREQEAARQARIQQLIGSGLPRLGNLIPDDYDDALNRESDIEQALTQIIEGRDYNGFTVTVDSTDISEDEIQFGGSVYSSDGSYVGSVERTFRREHDGTLYAIHDYLNLDRSARGQGFAEAWNGFLQTCYEHSGFERIEVHANIDVGGYTWARQGFTWANESDAVRLANLLERQLTRSETELSSMALDDPDRLGLQAEIDAAEEILQRINDEPFGSDDYPTAYEMSQCGRRPHHTGRDASWIGKRACWARTGKG
ncbi:hypothetical protein BJF83_17355 [Nocardiopsis sp. CNR-923]|nr:hypothetical protein BJF83_17355 [Nocardiopsis sp. CNR-923]